MIKHTIIKKGLALVSVFIVCTCYSQFMGFGSSGDTKSKGFVPIKLELHWAVLNDPLGKLGAFNTSHSGYMVKIRFDTEVTEQYPYSLGGGLVFKSAKYSPKSPIYYGFTKLANGNKTYFTEKFDVASNYQWGGYINYEMLFNGNIILAPKFGVCKSIWTVFSEIEIYGDPNKYSIDSGGGFITYSPGLEVKFLLTKKFGFVLDYEFNWHVVDGLIGARTLKNWQISIGAYIQLRDRTKKDKR